MWSELASAVLTDSGGAMPSSSAAVAGGNHAVSGPALGPYPFAATSGPGAIGLSVNASPLRIAAGVLAVALMLKRRG